MGKLYKTTIVIWSEYNPSCICDCEDLARDATNGESYCAKMETEEIQNPEQDKDWDGTEFFTE